jgi:hypothetical protein
MSNFPHYPLHKQNLETRPEILSTQQQFPKAQISLAKTPSNPSPNAPTKGDHFKKNYRGRQRKREKRRNAKAVDMEADKVMLGCGNNAVTQQPEQGNRSEKVNSAIQALQK